MNVNTTMQGKTQVDTFNLKSIILVIYLKGKDRKTNIFYYWFVITYYYIVIC